MTWLKACLRRAALVPAPLALDFASDRGASRWLGRAVMLVALAASAHVGVSYVHTRERVAESESRLASLGARPERSLAGNASAEEMAAARDTIERLSLAWGNLFDALEQSLGSVGTTPGEVALLGIEPDARTGTALVTAEAKDYEAALAYVERLSRAPRLHGVHLVRHELRGEGGRRPLAFSVSVSWKESR